MTKYSLFNAITLAFRWWLDGLLAWLPDSVRQQGQQQAYIQCAIESEQLTMTRMDKMGKKIDEVSFELEAVSANNESLTSWLKPYQHDELVLAVPDEHCLTKTITLPAQAQANLAEMVYFEVDRQTPFSNDKVYVGYHVKDKGKGDRPLLLQLAVVPKQAINKLIDALAALSLPIQSLQIIPLEPNDSEIKITIAENKNNDVLRLKLNCFLMAVACTLFLTFLYSPIIKFESALEAIQPALAEAKKQAVVVSKLKKDNGLMAEQVQFIDSRLTDYHFRIAILKKLTQLLPTHTWLEQSEIKDNILTIRGESAAAPDLIALLTNTGYFSDVHFSAPTTHNEKTAKDRFRIQALILSEGGVNGS